jgi:hypothetical protein
VTKTVTLPGVGDDINRTINGLLDKLAGHADRNLLRSSYYDGKHAVRSVGSIIPPEYLRAAIVLGWSAKAVDTLARRCNLEGFIWTDGDLDALGADKVWTDNWLGSEASSALVSSLIHGVSFLVNTVGGTGEPRALIHVKDATNATGEWNFRTRRLDNLLSITQRHLETGDPTALTLYLDGETITAEIGATGRWTVERTRHSWGVPCEALTYHPRQARPLGASRISRPVMSLHDRALRCAIRMEGHADVYSFPQLVLLGADEGVFRNPDGSLKPAWKIALGRVFALSDDETQENPRADVKQFQAQTPQPHIEQFKQLAQSFSGETSIPLTSLGVSDMSNPTSADSYIASREDLIAEAEGATDDWTPPLARAFARALAIANSERGIPEAFGSIDCKWRNPVYLTRAAAADAGSKQLAAVPWLAETEVGLELLGLTEQQVQRAMSERRRAAGRATLDRIAAAAATVAAPEPAPAAEVPSAAAAS